MEYRTFRLARCSDRKLTRSPRWGGIEQTLSTGGLVNDETMVEVVTARLQRADAKSGFVLDGFPRTMGQAVAFERISSTAGIDAVIELTVSED